MTNNQDQQPRFLTPKEVAEILRVSPETVRALVATGRLRGMRVGLGKKAGRIRISSQDVENYIRQQQGKMEASAAPLAGSRLCGNGYELLVRHGLKR